MPAFAIERTWTHTTAVIADDEEKALNDPSLEERFMEAYTQGDGRVSDKVVAP
jgi:hypothetical protein